MGRDITRPVVIRAVARDTLMEDWRKRWVAGRRAGTRRVPGDKDDGHGRRTGLQGVVDEDGREVDVCYGAGTSLWEDWDAVQMGGKVGNERELSGLSFLMSRPIVWV